MEGSQWLYKVAPENLSIDPEKPVIEENVFEYISSDRTGIFAEGINMLNDLISNQRLKKKTGVESAGEISPNPYVFKLTRYSRAVFVIKRYSKHIVVTMSILIILIVLFFAFGD